MMQGHRCVDFICDFLALFSSALWPLGLGKKFLACVRIRWVGLDGEGGGLLRSASDYPIVRLDLQLIADR